MIFNEQIQLLTILNNKMMNVWKLIRKKYIIMKFNLILIMITNIIYTDFIISLKYFYLILKIN